MENEKIQLLEKKATLEARLAEMIFGAIEVRVERKSKQIYVHYRIGGKQVTKYVGPYSPELFELVSNNNQKARVLKKELREVTHRLNRLGYADVDLSDKIKRNLDFAKRNLALTIHSQAILEGVATTFASTEEVIEGAKVQGMSAKDIQKILNMKHAWEFILDKDVVLSPSDLGLAMQINKLVEEGFYYSAGKLRDVPVNIGGTAWRPEMPIESMVKEDLIKIAQSKVSIVERAINLALYIQRSQLFLDGNKRTAVIFANHFLIAHGSGLLYIPEDLVEEYKKLLVAYYETGQKAEIVTFLKEKCYLAI